MINVQCDRCSEMFDIEDEPHMDIDDFYFHITCGIKKLIETGVIEADNVEQVKEYL